MWSIYFKKHATFAEDNTRKPNDPAYHNGNITLEEAAEKLDSAFELDTITEKEVTAFLDARTAYKKTVKNLQSASQPESGEADDFSDKVPVFE